MSNHTDMIRQIMDLPNQPNTRSCNSSIIGPSKFQFNHVGHAITSYGTGRTIKVKSHN